MQFITSMTKRRLWQCIRSFSRENSLWTCSPILRWGGDRLHWSPLTTFFIFTIAFKPCCVGGGTGYIDPHLFLSVNACQSEFNSRVHAWCTCIWTHFFTCKSENLNLCFWICEIIAAPKRLHSSTQKQIVFICFISFVYTLNTKGTWMQTLWRRNQVIRYVFNFFPIRIRKIHLLVLLHYASTTSTFMD